MNRLHFIHFGREICSDLEAADSFIFKRPIQDYDDGESMIAGHPWSAAYQAHYCGDVRERDGAYHQGTVWAWLLSHYVLADYKISQDIG
jgi:hypothetical protein